MAASNVNQTIGDEPVCSNITDQTVSGEFSLHDWQLINQSFDRAASSDDESIEVIEREVANPFSEFRNSDDSEVDNSEVEGVDIQPEPVSTDVVDKRIQTKESTKCQSCLQIAPTTNVTDVAQSISLKILYSVTLCVCISIFIDQYKGYVFEKWLSGIQLKNDVPDPVTFDEVLVPTRPLYSSSSHKVNDPVDTLISRLYLDVVQKKQLLDDTFADQLDILNAAKQLKDNIYMLNVTKLNPATARRFFVWFERNPAADLLNLATEILPCHAKLKANKLPSTCRTMHAIIVLLEQSQLIAAYENVGKFFDEFTGRSNEKGEDLVEILTQPESAYDKETRESNLVPDCDSFSKNFKSNSYCVEDGSDSAAPSTNEVDLEASLRKLEEKLKGTLQASEDTRMLSTIEDGKGVYKNRKLTPEMLLFLRQFKHDFDQLYRMYVPDDMVKDSTEASPGQTEAGEEKATSATEPDEEWFTNAKFRKYYDEALSGDWILKLGKAREELRKYWGSTEEEKKEKKSAKREDWLGNIYENLQHDFEKLTHKWTGMFDKKTKKAESRERWYEKTQEKLKNKFEKYSSEWKHNMKKAKEGILDHYKHLQSKLKRVYDGYF